MATLGEALFDTAAASKAARTLATELDKLSKKSRESGEKLDTLGKKSRRTSTEVGRLRRSVGNLLGAFVGFRALTGVISSTVKTQVSFENLTARIRAVTGSVPAATKQFVNIRARVNELGLDLIENAKGFSNFAAASKDLELTQKVFQGITAASGALRLSVDDQHGVWRALTQIMSKGKVQAEEIRGQLGERLPGAFRIAAESIGVTQQELSLMLDKGELASERLLPRFAKAMEDAFGKDAQENAETLGAKIQRVNNELFRWRTLIASGFINEFKDSLNEATGQLESADSVALAFGKSLGFVARMATKGSNALATLGKNVGTFLAAGGRDFSKGGPTSLIAALFGVDFSESASKANALIRELEKSMTRLESLRHKGDKIFLLGNVVLTDWIKALQELQTEGKDLSQVQAELNPLTERLVKQYQELGVELPGLVQGFLDMADAERKAKSGSEELGDDLGKTAKEIAKLQKEASSFADKTKSEFTQALEDLAKVDALEGFFESPEVFAAVREFFAGRLRIIIAEAANETAAFIKEQADNLADFLEENLRERTGSGQPIDPGMFPVQVDDIDTGPGLEQAVADERRRKMLVGVVSTTKSLAVAFRGVNREISRGLKMISDLALKWEELPAGTKKWAVALQAAGQILSGLLSSAKNFAKEGAAFGAAIGAAVGASSGNSQAGAAIGETIGAVVGSLIKSGADRFIAEFGTGTVGQDLSFFISQIEGATGALGKQLVDGILGSLQSLSDRIGGEITVAKFSVMIEDELVKLFINGLEFTFNSVAEALPTAISELLRTSTIAGVGDQVRAALTSGNFESFEELEAVLSLAHELEDQAGKWAEAQREVNKTNAEAIRLAKKHNLDLDLVNAANQKRLDLLQREIDQAGASEIGNIIGLLRQVHGEQFAASELQLAQTQLLALQILNSRDALVELVAAGTALSDVASGLLDIVDATVEGLLSGKLKRRRGGGDRGAARDSFNDELAGIITSGLDDVSRMYEEYERRVADLIKRQRELGGSSQLLEQALASLDSQLHANLRSLGESIIRSLSPIADLVFGVRDTVEAFKTLEENMEDFGFTAEQVQNTLRDFGENVHIRIGLGLAQIIGDEKLIQEFQIEAQKLQIDMWEFEIRMLLEAGILEQERYDDLLELINRARDATDDWADSLDDVEENFQNLTDPHPQEGDPLRALTDIVNERDKDWRKRVEQERREREEQDRREAEEAARRYRDRAAGIAEDIAQYQQGLGVSSRSPLRLLDRANIAEQNFFSAFSRAKTGDLDSAENLTDLFDAALDLRRLTDPRGGARYQSFFAQGNDALTIIRQLLGDDSVDVVPPAKETADNTKDAADNLRLMKTTGEQQLESMRNIEGLTVKMESHLKNIRSAQVNGHLRVRLV